jgi:hypothetical protein
VSETVTIPAGTTSVNIRCFADGTPQGSAWVDAVSFYATPAVTLTATRRSEVQVDLAWTDNLTDRSGYRVERCIADNCSFVQVGADLPATATGYSDTGLAVNTTYSYRVTAFKSAPCGWTRTSDPVSTKTTLLGPDGLVVTPVSTSQINLIWNDRSATETGFKIERCAGDGCGDYAQIDYVTTPTVFASYSFNNTLNDASPSGLNLTGSTPAFEDGGVALSTTTSFASAATAVLDSDNHTIEFDLKIRGTNSTWTKVFGYAPTGSDRSPGIWVEPGGKRLHWRYDPGNTGVGYLGTDGDGGTPLTMGSWYHIRGVKAGASFKAYVNEVLVADITVASPKSAGSAPLWFGGADVTLKNFTIYQGAGLRNGTYTDTSICSGTSYRYRVRAANTVVPWNSDYTPEVPAVRTPAPVAPTGLVATAATDTQIDLSWNDTTNDELGFKIERCVSTGCTDFAQVATRGVDKTSYSNTALSPSTTYCYRVRAYKQGTCGWDTEYTLPACALTISAHPTTLTATPLNAFKIRLDWADNASDEDGYEIEAQVWNGKWVKTGSVGANVHTLTDTAGIEPQKSYNYRVRAVRGALKSPYSNEAPATTPAYVSGDNTCNYKMTVITSGAGKVSVAPAGVSCGVTDTSLCYAYCAGVQLNLSAFPATGAAFEGWSGSCGGASPTCTLVMDGDKTLGATFQ